MGGLIKGFSYEQQNSTTSKIIEKVLGNYTDHFEQASATPANLQKKLHLDQVEPEQNLVSFETVLSTRENFLDKPAKTVIIEIDEGTLTNSSPANKFPKRTSKDQLKLPLK